MAFATYYGEFPTNIAKKHLLIQVELQLFKEKIYTFNEEIQKLKKPEQLITQFDFTTTEVDALKEFCRVQKVKWYYLLQTLSTKLNDPVTFIIGFGFPQYFKAYLDKCNIPILDLSNAALCSKLELALKSERAMYLIRDYVNNYKLHNAYVLPYWTDELHTKFDYIPKILSDY